MLEFPPRTDADEDDLSFATPDSPRRRHRRQALSGPLTLSRYLLTALGLVLALLVVGWLVIQLGQLGRPASGSAGSIVGAPAQRAAAPAPAAQDPAPPPGTGPIRATSRVLEPSYTVAPGDTLGSIATRFGTTVDALQSINNLADRNVLSVGQKLVIPNQP